jgi:hypothetical protein
METSPSDIIVYVHRASTRILRTRYPKKLIAHVLLAMATMHDVDCCNGQHET